MGIGRLLLVRFKNAASNSARCFSSSAELIRRPWTHLTDEPEDSDSESSVYKRALKLQRPTTVKYQESLHNYVSLIGTIELPLKACNSAELGFHTFLIVKASSNPYRYFRVMLKFWHVMAEMSVHHLKPDDLIYVSGRLGSYRKVNEHGKSVHNYEVDVTEINFVAQHGPLPACQNPMKWKTKVSAEDWMQKRIARHHLWHVFFANPNEWWDNRNCKKHPNSPDFKHKDTGEKLWLYDTDPPWIKQQLQLIDSRLSKQNPGEHRHASSHLSPLVYDDTKGN
ncbi:hypothetical protein CDL12_16160 [Handroanthus impetiginosus]|uniref:Uncharacterized protein n=1 Tax=Handroanthus impetiginosus TaxID=429701 RepID=A0A2G9H131_9LAMI|nr:hypothetical protein CDL12_16160 [Handroanthus impetiginosus]